MSLPSPAMPLPSLFCSEIYQEVLDLQLGPSSIEVRPMVDKVLVNDSRVLANMLKEEKMSQADITDYFTPGSTVQTSVKPHMRKIVTDWMSEVCQDQQCQPEVFCHAVNYLDRFLTRLNINKNQFQLLASVCLLLASKLQGCPISLTTLVDYTDNSFLPEEIKQWEILVLSVLHWNLNVLTPLSFLNLLLQHLGLTSLRYQVEQLVLVLQTDLEMASSPPSVVAAAATLSIYQNTDPPSKEVENLVQNITKFVKVSRQDLCSLYIRIQQVVQDQFDQAVLDNTSSEEQSDDKLVVGEEGEYFLYEQQNDHKQTFSTSFNPLVC